MNNHHPTQSIRCQVGRQPVDHSLELDLTANVRELQEMLEPSSAPERATPIAVSHTMQSAIAKARKFARSSATVLLTGESGTGKEVIARLIHQSSRRADRPYVRVNCAALPESLMESELFGYQRGAFTGALESRRGHLAAAEDGTILLDEISEIPYGLQAKLLRVLEEEEFQPLGSDRLQRVDARVVATTNRCLERDVAEGRFREDLFYRLNVLQLELPPLRNRPEDVGPLVDYFIGHFRDEASQTVRGIQHDAYRALVEYDWPGNVRQLRNLIHRACVVNESGVIGREDLTLLPPPESAPSSTKQLEEMRLDDVERHVILLSLERHQGNKTAAARQLGVTPRTLTNKMKRYRQLGQV